MWGWLRAAPTADLHLEPWGEACISLEWEWQGFLKPQQLSATSDTAVTRALVVVEFALVAGKGGAHGRTGAGFAMLRL